MAKRRKNYVLVRGYRITIRRDAGGLSPYTLMIEAPTGQVVYDDESGFDTRAAARSYARTRFGL